MYIKNKEYCDILLKNKFNYIDIYYDSLVNILC